MAADQGDGAVDLTAFTQRLAEVLGLPVDDVRRGVMRALPRLSLRDLTARHVTAALDELSARIREVLGTPPPPMFDDGNYTGRMGCSEHRTAGGRAWCFECSEWCYPRSYACPCCYPPPDPDAIRAVLDHLPHLTHERRDPRPGRRGPTRTEMRNP